MPVDARPGIDKSAVARRFNRSAGSYDSHCRMQRRMARRLMDLLERRAAHPESILELGCGTGVLTALLAARYPAASLLAVDIAELMIDVARDRVTGDLVRFEVADAEEMPVDRAGFDLIVSNATIQWFDRPRRTVERLAEALTPGGLSCHSTFGPRTFEELRRTIRQEDQGASSGIALRSAPRWADLARQAGLVGVRADATCERQHYPGAWEFLSELQATGVTYLPEGASRRASPGRLAALAAAYEGSFGSEAGVPVTYELVELAGSRPW